ncbi:MAG TPA: pilus assembly protein TadG-related protein [Pseudolabrys sp.]|nr:pilus assembly protein TadG-related protein [Pseudolabrys sp.]
MPTMTPVLLKRLGPPVTAFWRDTSGVILPYVTVMLVVIIGVALLALDGARYMSLQTQLQNGADALALAGAAELDRLPSSEIRAVNAVNNLVVNSSIFGTGVDRNVRVSQIQFYSQLPASDLSPLSAATLANDPTTARYVSVAVRPISLRTIIPSLVGNLKPLAVGASAVAGFNQVVCHVTPLFVCNPFELPGMGYEQATRALEEATHDPAIRRRLIRLRQYGSSLEPYVPGDYGFLLSPSLQDGTGLVDALARVRPAVCFSQSAVNFRAGYLAAVSDAMNVRFDIYERSMAGQRNDLNFRPAVNVRKGYITGGAGSCTANAASNWPIGSPPQQATGLPLDRNWPYMDGGMGQGNWDIETYWQVNHGADGRPLPTIDGAVVSNANPPSRYSVYRYEIDNGFVADRSPGGESGAPACYAGGDLSDVPDRRILQAAVVNCLSLNLAGSAQFNIPVAAFAKFFLTLPLQRSQTDLYVETVGLIGPGDRGNHDIVQLYR